MLTVAPGEIRPTDFEIISPELAQKLGADILGHLEKFQIESEDPYFGYRLRLYPEKKSSEMFFGLRLDTDTYGVLDEILKEYTVLLNPTDAEFDRYAHWLIPGIDGRQIPWHTDTPGDARFMLNMGENSADVWVANKWNPENYYPGEPDGIEPDSFSKLSINPGQLYVSNALVLDPAILRPHQTPIDPSRFMLRTSIYAAEGWKDKAMGDGVTIQLGKS